MIIREGEEKYIPSIVELLKLSLGESLMPKSEVFWRWKHIDNPFGPSPVLLAFEGDVLVGVRAFMRWEWQQGNKILKAVRAVDTATHPEHQGKGIFKKLTMQLVEQCKAEGIHFIFNTPNKISMPGYLKMGWESRGKLPVRASVHLFRKSGDPRVSRDDWNALAYHSLLQQGEVASAKIKTRLSADYLLWRYRDNPNAEYRVVSADHKHPFVLIYRVKNEKVIPEIRVTEIICEKKNMVHALESLKACESGIKIITTSEKGIHGFFPLPVGPIVTTRNLNLPSYPESLSFVTWSPTLGDLELF